MIAILHMKLRLPGTLHRTLQVLSFHPFGKVNLNDRPAEIGHRHFLNQDSNEWDSIQLQSNTGDLGLLVSWVNCPGCWIDWT
jgi:hypothetical protein